MILNPIFPVKEKRKFRFQLQEIVIYFYAPEYFNLLSKIAPVNKFSSINF